MLRDREGGLMHTGRYWDPETREHTSGAGPNERCFAAVPQDVDQDGDLDLIFGTDKGNLFVRFNVGTAKKPSFAPKLHDLPGAKGAASFPDGYAMPIVVDWDGDGLWDLVSAGKKNGVSWLRNVGEATEPRFAKAEALVSVADAKRHGVGERTQVGVGDIDADGDFDLVVGDYEYESDGDNGHRFHGRVWLYRRTGSPTTPSRAVPASASSRGDGSGD